MAALEVKVEPDARVPADLKLVTVDMAVGGARCAANKPIDADTQMRIVITLVGSDPAQSSSVNADAVVLRCVERPEAPEPRRYEVALKFERMENAERRTLQLYLNKL